MVAGPSPWRGLLGPPLAVPLGELPYLRGLRDRETLGRGVGGELSGAGGWRAFWGAFISRLRRCH